MELQGYSNAETSTAFLKPIREKQSNYGWVREEVTANLCLGAKAAVQEKYTSSPSWLTGEMRSNNGVRPPCRRGQRNSSGVLKPVFILLSM